MKQQIILKIFITTFITVSIFLINSCNKKEVKPHCKYVLHSPKDFLDYWFFPKGSWWVYKLKGSNPAVYDTVRADFKYYANPENHFYPNDYLDTCSMVYEYGLGHSNREYFPGAGDSPFPAVEGFSSIATPTRQSIRQNWNSAYASEGYIFSYPIILGYRSGCCENWASDTNAVVTPEFTFPRSVTFMNGYYTPDSSEYITRKISFTNKVGITYRKYFNGNEWELIDYNIDN